MEYNLNKWPQEESKVEGGALGLLGYFSSFFEWIGHNLFKGASISEGDARKMLSIFYRTIQYSKLYVMLRAFRLERYRQRYSNSPHLFTARIRSHVFIFLLLD